MMMHTKRIGRSASERMKCSLRGLSYTTGAIHSKSLRSSKSDVSDFSHTFVRKL